MGVVAVIYIYREKWERCHHSARGHPELHPELHSQGYIAIVAVCSGAQVAASLWSFALSAQTLGHMVSIAHLWRLQSIIYCRGHWNRCSRKGHAWIADSSSPHVCTHGIC